MVKNLYNTMSDWMKKASGRLTGLDKKYIQNGIDALREDDAEIEIRKRKYNLGKRQLAKLIQETFCNSANQSKIVGCSYLDESWCQKKCDYAKKRMLERVKYWNR